ncbi:MAG: hypothetical protein ACXWCR_08220 [Flavitalea sp.]
MKKFVRCGELKFVIMFFLSVFSICRTGAQNPNPRHALQLTAGYSVHGSGDMRGIGMGAEYIHHRSQKLFLNYNLRTTINNENGY